MRCIVIWGFQQVAKKQNLPLKNQAKCLYFEKNEIIMKLEIEEWQILLWHGHDLIIHPIVDISRIKLTECLLTFLQIAWIITNSLLDIAPFSFIKFFDGDYWNQGKEWRAQHCTAPLIWLILYKSCVKLKECLFFIRSVIF